MCIQDKWLNNTATKGTPEVYIRWPSMATKKSVEHTWMSEDNFWKEVCPLSSHVGPRVWTQVIRELFHLASPAAMLYLEKHCKEFLSTWLYFISQQMDIFCSYEFPASCTDWKEVVHRAWVAHHGSHIVILYTASVLRKAMGSKGHSREVQNVRCYWCSSKCYLLQYILHCH